MKTRQRPFVLFLVPFSLLYAAAVCFSPPGHTQQSPATGAVETKGGLQVVTVDAPQGRITVNLPDDVVAGDTISGTVVEEPKGNTPAEKEKNKTSLDALVIDLQGTQVAANKPQFTWLPPAPVPPARPRYQLRIIEILKDPPPSQTHVYFECLIKSFEMPKLSAGESDPLKERLTIRTEKFDLPQIGQAGKTSEITGPFDGNAGNTILTVGNQQITPLAESPRKLVFESPGNVTGPVEIAVKEGNKETKGTYRNVGVNLTAPKTNLLKGEHTELTVQVNGLQGITQPVPLTLDSRGVITMEGGMFQPLIIQPSQIGADGRYTTTRGITGVQTGGWTSTATVVTQPFNIVLRDPDPPQTILVNSFTGDYVFCGAGPKLTGTGQIKRQGCVIDLTDKKPDRQVQGTFNSCVPLDNGKFFTFYSPGTNTEIKLIVTDTQPPRKRIYFTPLSRPMPPVQDVSAFATCP